MRAAGWQGVGSDSASSSRVDLHSPDSPPLDKRGSADSGYSEGSHDEKSGYFGNWNKIKKAMWGGEEEEGAPERVPTPQSYVWDKIMAATSVVSVGVSESVARARLGEDDDTIGPDGDTKLTRVIKEYHISQATCSEDLPHWLFTASELSVRTSAASRAAEREEREHSYSSHHDRPVHRQVSNVSTDSYSRARRGSIEDFNPYTHQAPARRGSASSEHGLPPGVASRAADRLRAMREAKRSAH
ncbi:hypothetical protein MNV49_007037 [Pseudohyphozyma bogoriensis]|nr:hypothetical protein MNV49_007037 [Pseudohyphozyma bogoriensis]